MLRLPNKLILKLTFMMISNLPLYITSFNEHIAIEIFFEEKFIKLFPSCAKPSCFKARLRAKLLIPKCCFYCHTLIKLIFTRKILHLASFSDQRERLEVGNGQRDTIT